MKLSLKIQAGRDALKRLRREGIDSNDVGTLAGAAGGPKWLALSQLDKALFGSWLKTDRVKPLFLVGSSIATWRFTAATQRNPIEAIEKFEEAYLGQRYSLKPTPQDVTEEGSRVLAQYLTDSAIKDLLDHPYYRMNVVAVRCKNIFKLESKPALIAGLGLAASFNSIHPTLLNNFFERTLFVDSREKAPFLNNGILKAKTYDLTFENYRKTLLASGSIPGVMSAIVDLHSDRKVVYRDGGMLDYHMDLPYAESPVDNQYTLFPHYTDKITPGWFDKHLPWRKASQENFRNVVLISPTKEFIAKLPHAKIPDRSDFYLYKGRDKERIQYWRTVIKECERLKDDFLKVFESNRVAEFVEPL